jgi:putative FmdB family regulatory protein
MPLYDVRCTACQHEFEALVRGGNEPVCEACGGRDLERLLSLPAVQSEVTREAGMRAARRRDQAQAKDRVHEQVKYERSHND